MDTEEFRHNRFTTRLSSNGTNFLGTLLTYRQLLFLRNDSIYRSNTNNFFIICKQDRLVEAIYGLWIIFNNNTKTYTLHIFTRSSSVVEIGRPRIYKLVLLSFSPSCSESPEYKLLLLWWWWLLWWWLPWCWWWWLLWLLLCDVWDVVLLLPWCCCCCWLLFNMWDGYWMYA